MIVCYFFPLFFIPPPPAMKSFTFYFDHRVADVFTSPYPLGLFDLLWLLLLPTFSYPLVASACMPDHPVERRRLETTKAYPEL